MAKPSRDDLLQVGESLLTEWGVASDAGGADLAAVTGREAAADLAIARRLGSLAEQDSVVTLRRLERETAHKQVRKEAKRALYRLLQRGVRVPEPPSSAPVRFVSAPIEGYVSPIDGRGDQLVWLVKPQPVGVEYLFAVINDPEGLREVALSPISRKALKAIWSELASKHDVRLVEIDWRYADFLIHRAFGWARERGTRMSGDYPALRAQLTREAAVADLPPAVMSQIDAAAIGSDQSLLASTAGLLEEKEFRTWFLHGEQLESYLRELESIKDSPLVLNRLQQEERFEAVISRAVGEVFTSPMRESWVRRLYEMAYFFSATARRERALETASVAQALTAARSAREIPFCEQLVRASLAFFFQVALQEEAEREKSSLVVTPRQATRAGRAGSNPGVHKEGG